MWRGRKVKCLVFNWKIKRELVSLNEYKVAEWLIAKLLSDFFFYFLNEWKVMAVLSLKQIWNQINLFNSKNSEFRKTLAPQVFIFTTLITLEVLMQYAYKYSGLALSVCSLYAHFPLHGWINTHNIVNAGIYRFFW